MIYHHRSFSVQSRQQIFVVFCAIATILFVVLSTSSTPPAVKAKSEKSRASFFSVSKSQTADTGCCGSEEGDQKPHLLAGSYYTLKGGFSAKLLLNNKGPSPIEVKPTIFAMSGQRFDAPAVVVAGNSYQFINVADWASAAGPEFQEGSIQLFHRGKDLVLGTQIYLTDDAHNLGFEEKLSEPANSKSTALAGVWWLPSPKGAVALVLSNTTENTFSSSIRILGEAPKREGRMTVDLLPHETKVFDVGQILGKRDGAMSRFGSVSLQHNGSPGALVARAMARETAIGYSLPVQFSDPKGGKSTTLQGAGLRVGKVGRELLSPTVVAHNAGQMETTVTGRVQYTNTDGTNGVVFLPDLKLAPEQTEVIDVAQALRAHNMISKIQAASLEFEYTGETGRLITSAFSVSQSGDQVFRVPLWDIAAQRSATGGYPWYIDGDSSTVIFIKNVTDEPRQFTLQFRYDGGTYVAGLRTIEPRQTVMFDVRSLRDQQVPDETGRPIPLEAVSGQVNWSMRGPQNQVLIGRSEQVDIAGGISSNYACMNCCPDSFHGAWVDPGGAITFVGDLTQFNGFEQTVNCYGSVNGAFNPWPNWDSSNWDILGLCEGVGLATGESPGTASIQARWMGYEWGSFESGNPNECYERPIDVLVDAICDVLDPPVQFIDARLVDTSRVAQFIFASANLTINTCSGERFAVKVRFQLPPESAACCDDPTTSFARLRGNNKFQLAPSPVDGTTWDFFGNDSPPFVIVYLRKRADGGGSDDTLAVQVGGRYPSGEKYHGQGFVHLICE